MAISTDTPQGRRRERVAARLHEALAVLRADPAAELTAAALARRAGIGRNTLYTNHRPALEDLRALQVERSSAEQREGTTTCKRETSIAIDARVTALATENASLLRRTLIAETRAKRLEERNAELVRALGEQRKVTTMPVGTLGRPEE
ncbi:hypothetical protein [uncultured Bradyrhizobium sp.]|nr:hypothetical protein [uncultured Bradyrhizobium sp.]